jgi:hypothetical protein
VKAGGMNAALEALRCAKLANAEARQAQDSKAFFAAWSTYLTEVTRTFNMIFSAINDDVPEEKAWKKDLSDIRLRDELLNWLRVARDLKDHNSTVTVTQTINPHTHRLGFSSRPGGQGGFAGFEFRIPGTFRLMPLSDKKQMLEPPERHSQKSLREDWGCKNLFDVTDLAIAFLEAKISEATAQFR